MDAPNRFEQLVSESQAAVMVLGTPALDDFTFVEIGTAAMDAVDEHVKNGAVLVCVIGVDGAGTPRVALNIPFQYDVMARVCDAFTERVKSEWLGAELERWAALPDTRPDRTVN